MSYISWTPVVLWNSNEEEAEKQLFQDAHLTPKNEDLNNFYQDSLKNATEVINTAVKGKLLHLI